MIVGVFLRHYKIFKNINYIPLSDGESFSAIIGDNGVGKSTVLEALDHIMNEKDDVEWFRNNQAKSEGSSDDLYITPVFLLEKKSIPNRTVKAKNLKGAKYADIISALSEMFWNTNYSPSEAHAKFYEHRDRLKELGYHEDKLLMIGGRRQTNLNAFHFGPYNTISQDGPLPILKKLFCKKDLKIDYFEVILNDLYEDIRDKYKYIYLPVELDVHEYSKLESESMQHLMDRKITNDIQKLFDDEIVGRINDRLKNYIDDIQGSMDGYVYKNMGFKEKLSSQDLTDKAIEKFFSIKVLNKEDANGNTLPINHLSSGEKKKALIDLVHSFLKEGNDKDREVIIAIDEPESSINVSSSYDQFEKVKSISQNNQVLITTHWYGFLPVMMDGILLFISLNNDNSVSSFPMRLGHIPTELRNIRKKIKGPLPSSIEIKSTTDLVQSIISSLQADKPYNWLICEGASEKIYFEYFLADEIKNKNLRILPVGGNKYVKKFYDYLLTPITDNEADFKGKIICLIDTDEQILEVGLNKSAKVLKRIKFLRLLRRNQSIALVDADDNTGYPPTEIEDALHRVPFRTVLKDLGEHLGDGHFLKELDGFEESNEADISALAYNLTEPQRNTVKGFFNGNEGKNKLTFAKKYVEKNKDYTVDRTPEWIEELKKEFK
jgi:ABC-type Mn2+/Zn2+ transport system ATPase subunit